MQSREDFWSTAVVALERACRAGASSAFDWLGKLNKERADGAAAEAIRLSLSSSRIPIRIVAGEGAKDGVEHIAVGEVLLSGDGVPAVELAIDPIEGTTSLAHGLPWALTTASITPAGGMLKTGPSLYMDKLVVARTAAQGLDPEADTAGRLRSISRSLGKPIDELKIFLLDKPRHQGLAREIVQAGAQVAFYPAGDVVGSCSVALGETFDAAMGIGGTPEGMLSACAVRALGGAFFARLMPQREDEAEAMRRSSIAAGRWLAVHELIRSDRAAFCAAGITQSELAPGIEVDGDFLRVSTITIGGNAGRVTRTQTQLLRKHGPNAT